MEIELYLQHCHRQSLSVIVESWATTATGFWPTAKSVRANTVEVPSITVVPPGSSGQRQRNQESFANKNVAGLPSCARIKTSRRFSPPNG
jgi:hypothetical protein